MVRSLRRGGYRSARRVAFEDVDAGHLGHRAADAVHEFGGLEGAHLAGAHYYMIMDAAGNGAPDLGLLAASFVLGTLPLLIITVPLLRYYTQGLLGGAIKG